MGFSFIYGLSHLSLRLLVLSLSILDGKRMSGIMNYIDGTMIKALLIWCLPATAMTYFFPVTAS